MKKRLLFLIAVLAVLMIMATALLGASQSRGDKSYYQHEGGLQFAYGREIMGWLFGDH